VGNDQGEARQLNLFENIEVEPAAVVERLRNGEKLKLVDVREDWEWEYVRIPEASHLPLNQIEARHAALLSVDEPVVLYCHSGMRSLQAAIWLRQQGYAKVQSLAGGVNRWADDIDPDMPRY
jgi:rhodanese-related sulfurtransferase